MTEETPSVARVYDYYLGGTAHRAVDRQFGDVVLAAFPSVRSIARANRIFLHRAVRRLVRLGVRQFVDIGSGLPTMGSTHAVADEVAPGAATVVYVDNDPEVVAHSRAIIAADGEPGRHAAIHGDLRDPGRLWRAIDDTGLIAAARPVGLLMIAVLHLRQLDANGVDIGSQAVARFRELLPNGSYLALSHATKDGVPDHVKAGLADTSRAYLTNRSPAIWRTRAEIAGLFGDFELVEPGITWTPLWHPEETGPGTPEITFGTPAEAAVLAGLGRKS
ncbi:MAG TPA: SAM-dependent methyltransferase [Actinophytocola sp.]|uniref:SAM-dependent methyltransferase n=1 Tax=Actinophytocola sp. TaxID=1872138 RepID=UPI002DDCE7BA|nr:SAM-dependent methyltransferase [Actinophytocola sp.]HEV2778247.1 SAM-dependent methyltransferase [Actinophytocola sp.]